MRIRNRHDFDKPEVMIIPMIDIMFFLLVFFMIGTLYMVNLKTVPVNMPKAQSVETQLSVNYLVTMKADGSLWLEDKLIGEKELIAKAQAESARNPRFAVVVRADQSLDYGMVIGLLDKFKAAGITKFGLAAESGGK
ncbi:Biopolymer transport protein ExbD/TolR [Anaerovibrio sp. JC8]|uniref:ExbD/TolR family protein n=1 Tax=Anaerovibrio sp. JC8 TaxID=1240085 RepID=UPI000A0D48BE|nr:biopolymer transporter ExbD [Anaerovibrio sp. JC8]ORU00438.1 Biopolymer transport protein ExbD/TolR [Anaerovibrio sp. JC8]